jgi:ATP-dependent Clp protease ATP-binding subunit ClpA
MFERYTEKARRTIFFARYEASHYGSSNIETEHVLLGLLREDRNIVRLLPQVDADAIRKQIEDRTLVQPSISTAVDLPISNENKRVLGYAAEEADRLNNKHIGTEHLLLGLLREKSCFAARLLTERGADLAHLRSRIEKLNLAPVEPPRSYPIRRRKLRDEEAGSIEIHGSPRNIHHVHERVKHCRRYSWTKQAWSALDVVIDRKTGKASFNLSLADDATNFELVKGGCKEGYCCICRWELFESEEDADHGAGYTNGRDWLCNECYEKFWQRPDFFESSFSDIT